jgi:PAS domain S-box-containing protein
MFTLLYIDDEPGLLEIGRIYLENTGDFSVTTALSGRAGLEQLTQHDFDAIVADYQMPEMDGIELLKNVRQSFGNIPFILFTGRGREEVVIEAINNGVDFYLQKGGDPTAQFAELAHKVRQAVGRRRAEIGLSESEKRFRELADLLPQGIYEADTEGRMLYVNRIALEMSGYTAEDIEKGLNALNVIAPRDRQRAATLFQQMVETGSRSQGSAEYLALQKDGSTFPVSIFSSPIVKDGRITGIRGVIIDITEQKKAADELQAANEQLVATSEELKVQYDELAQSEARIRESEARFKTLFERSAEAQLLLDGMGKVADCNAAFLTLFALKEKEEIRGHSPEDFAPEFQPDGVSSSERGDEIIAILMREGMVRYEWAHLKHDAARTPILTEVICTLIQIAGQPMIHVSIRDVTDRKQTEKALRESEENYRGVIENLQDVVYRADVAGNITMASPSATEVFGYSSVDEVIGLNLARDIYLDPKNREDFLKAIQKTGSVKNFEAILKKKDGSPVIVSTSAHYYRDIYGNVLGVEGIAKDITEWKHAEEALRRSEARFRAVIDQSLQFIGLMDTDGTLIEANRSALAFAGISESDVINRPFWETPWWSHSKDLQEKLKDAIHRAASGETVRFEATHPAANGHLANIDFSVKPVVDPAGRILYLIPEGRDITERKRTEEALRESEEKFRALVESTSDFIWEVDAAGTYTYASPQVRRILGYEPEELLGKTPFEIMPPGEDKRVADEFKRCVDAQLPIVALENKAVRKDGSVVILETSGVIRTAEDGSYLGYRGIDRDITKRKQAEEALKESEARISSILHGSPVLQFVIDRNHRVISWNKALEEYSGIRAADMIGTDQQWRAFYTNKRPVLADLLIDGNTDAITRLYAGKLRKSRYVEEAYEATDFFPHMGSSGIWLSFTAAPIRDVQGTIIGAVETLEDVTERISAENALRESDKWTRTILNTAQAGIILVDANTHRIVDANRKALELIGLDQDSVIGAVCHRFICPAEEGKCPVTDLGQEVNTSERVLLTASGEKIPVLKTVVRLSMGGREILVESFVDISEQKRSEDAIRETNRKLNLLNSITRHDIRNQLMIAQGYTQLATFSKPEPVVADFLNKITAAVQTIQRQIEFTKEYQELGVHAPAWFMIRNIVSTVRPDKIAVRNTCNAVEIFADPMIDKVFYNLFDNAVKYGERMTTITISCEETDRGLVITFADNGVGIPVGEKQKIFEKGYGRNTGFGLFLVREILAITDISIEETGTEGKGAVFDITVPKGAYRKPE